MKKNDEKTFHRIMAIDYLKAMAVILVILTHALSKKQRLKIGGPFWISMAVPLFMILSGFTNSLSADKNKFDSLGDYFTKEELFSKLSRVLHPYLIIVLLELSIGVSQKVLFGTGRFLSFNLTDFIRYILTGGTTPGSYYILILVQFIFIFPFIHRIYRTIGNKSIILFFAIHLTFDFFANYLPISGKYYRILIFRYLAFIIVGIALYYSTHKIKKATKRLAVLSLIYIITYAYLGQIPKVFSKWTNTSLPTVFWAVALVLLGMTYLEKEETTKVMNLLNRVGKASYHIFLIQKLLFGFGLNKFFRYMNLSVLLSSTIAVLLCCFLGIVFYDLEFKKD